jgi:hypothetical protein
MNVNYTFTNTFSAFQINTPSTITFKPSFISLTGGSTPRFLSKIVYNFPDSTQTKIYTFNYYDYDDLTEDSRVDFVYTLPYSVNPQIITITVYIGPDLYSTPTTYTLSAQTVATNLTQSPLDYSQPYAFGEVHLLKSRAWGTNNNQVFLLETNNPNYLLVNYNG